MPVWTNRLCTLYLCEFGRWLEVDYAKGGMGGDKWWGKKYHNDQQKWLLEIPPHFSGSWNPGLIYAILCVHHGE
jgi:hypothetical protein